MKTSLYPVVMPPLCEPPFECAGNGLLYQCHTRAPLSDLRAWLFPNRKNSASFNRPKAWWQAQLVLYGLGIPKKSETIAALRARLEEAVLSGRCDSLPLQLTQTEARLNHAFLQANARRRREQLLQSGGTEDEAMAMEDPTLFLQRKFLESSNNDKRNRVADGVHVCVLKRLENGDRAAVHNAASSLGLHTISTDAPGSGFGSRWLVVGRDRAAVWSEKHKIDAQRAALEEQEKAAKRQKLEEEHVQYLLSRSAAAQGSKKAGKEEDPHADLRGRWHITCEYIDEQWPDRVPGSHPLSLYVYCQNDSVDDDDSDDCEASDVEQDSSDSDEESRGRGPDTLMAKFDFRVVLGLMKFSKDSEKAAKEKQKLRFRWRGMEEGTGEVLYDANGDQKGWIMFDSQGAKLSGSIAWQGKCTFSGMKLSEKVPAHAMADDWDDYGRSAHELARVRRWH